MFTGIVQGVGRVHEMEIRNGVLNYTISCDLSLCKGLELGASVSIDGCCQSVVKIENNLLSFQAIPETLKRTYLSQYQIGQSVHIERSAKFGDEIGGHILSGHIMSTGRLVKIEKTDSFIFHIQAPLECREYIFEKGFIALDGASLTLVDLNSEGVFTVHLIPETLERTMFLKKTVGSLFNIEIDAMTQMIVQTTKRILQK